MGINIVYDGVDLNTYFSVVDIKRNILPSRTNYFENTAYRTGATYLGGKYEPLLIQVSILINDDLNEKIDKLASILNVSEPRKLVFSDEGDRYYNAIIDGETNIEEVLNLGTGTLSFICLDPFAYALDKTIVDLGAIDNRKAIIEVDGSYVTYPKFEVDFTADTKFFGVTTNKGTVQVGTPDFIDGTQLSASEMLVNDFTDWKYNDLPLNTEGGKSQGDFDISEDGLTVLDYGSISTVGFNGPSYSVDIEESKNFEAILDIELGTLETDGSKNGKFEFNIVDNQDKIIAGISLTDTASIPLMSPQFYTSLNSYSVSASVVDLMYDSSNELTVEDLGRWNNFKGFLRIVKSGNDIVFTIQKMDGDNVIRKYMYTFSSSKYASEKAAKIGFWISRFGVTEPLDITIIKSVKFIKNNVEDWVNVPNLFREGDKLVINNLTGKIYLNNLEFIDYLDIGSTFFNLDVGKNNLLFSFNSSQAPNVKVEYNDCYL